MMKKVWVLFIALLTVAVLASVATAAPNGSNLHGEYSLIGTRTCIQTNLGADFVLPNYSLPPTGGSSRTTHYKGVLKLHRNGSGELSARAVLMNHNFGSFPTGQYNDECDATYQDLEDGTIQITISNCLSENLWPPPLANTYYGFSSYSLSMAVSSNGDTLLMSDAAMVPNVETVWTCGWDSSQPDCNTIISPQKRICIRSFTAIRLSPKP